MIITYESIFFFFPAFCHSLDLSFLKPHQIVQQGIIHCPERRRLFSESTVEENLMLGAYTINDKE